MAFHFKVIQELIWLMTKKSKKLCMSNCMCLQVFDWDVWKKIHQLQKIVFFVQFLTLSDTIPNFCSNVVAVCFDAKEWLLYKDIRSGIKFSLYASQFFLFLLHINLNRNISDITIICLDIKKPCKNHIICLQAVCLYCSPSSGMP